MVGTISVFGKAAYKFFDDSAMIYFKTSLFPVDGSATSPATLCPTKSPAVRMILTPS